MKTVVRLVDVTKIAARDGPLILGVNRFEGADARPRSGKRNFQRRLALQHLPNVVDLVHFFRGEDPDPYTLFRSLTTTPTRASSASASRT